MSATENISQNQWRIFFASLEQAESISTACRKSQIPRSTAYYFKRSDKTIAARWAESIEAGNDYLKDAARERAVDGVTSTHHQYDNRGNLIATHIETKYSDRLLLAILASRDPSFRQTSTDQVQRLLTQELTRMLDLFQRKLAPDVYQMIIDVLANAEDVIDVDAISQETPRYLTSNENGNAGISE